MLNADSIVDALVVSVNEILFFKYEKEAESQRKEPGRGFGPGTGQGSGISNNGDDKINKMAKTPKPLLL